MKAGDTSRIKMNIGLDTEVHAFAKAIAVLKGISLNKYFENAIRLEIERRRSSLDKIRK